MSEHAYQPTEIEKKWQKYWDEHGTNQTDLEGAKKPFYVLMMFPYPSAEGLHVGNVYAFTGADIQGRYHRLKGFDVFEPIGFDAFGIHSENYALKVGRHPLELIPSNTRNFTRQLKMMGLMYDWRQVVDTTSPEYYRWTQWIFIQLFKAGLAVRKEAPVTWCPDCKTVISDEFIDANDCCDRHPNTKVEKRNMTQWFFRITEYAARLHENLDWIDWSDSTRKMQRDWIGRSDGAEVDFAVESSRGTPDRETLNTETPDRETPAKKIRVFTTRPDTLFGATYMVLAPEHPLVNEIASPAQRAAVAQYRAESVIKTEVERAVDTKLKTGVFTGARAINPLTGEAIPIWISDYIMMGYGTGAIMAVPAHDTRDFAFAKMFHLPIRCILDPDVAAGDGECLADLAGDRKALLATEEGRKQIREWVLAGEECWAGPGRAINSANPELTINGLPVPEAKKKATEFVAAKGLGEAKVNFRLRDWCISRQRYWGPPIPMIHCPKCGVVPVPEDQLPVLLPKIDDFRPLGTGVSPLAACGDWVNVKCPECGAAARREADVSDNFLDSAWYFLRYPCANDHAHAFSEAMTRKWLPVDYYIGGNEHARLHLLYTRFITMALCDHAGLKMGEKGDPRDPREPFLKFRAHGMITRGGAKMSKSRGNIINPDEMAGKFGADTVRMYLMFLGPYAQGGDWQDEAISGIRRFLDRVWRFYFEETGQPGQAAQPALSDASDRSDASDQSDRAAQPAPSDQSERSDSTSTAEMPKSSLIKLHQTIKKLTEDIEAMSYNTAIAALMECLNALRAGSTGGAANPSGAVSQFARESFCILLAPFAPHLAEEIWSGALGKQPSVASAQWPSFDPALCVEDTVEIAVQINGKIRDRIVIPRDADEAAARAAAVAAEKIAPLLAGKTIVKFIYVQNRLANIIMK